MNISEDQIVEFWKQHLWKDIDIRLSSSIIFNKYPFEYDLDYHKGKKIYLGAFSNNTLVGTNSLHETGDMWRSRGLCVLPEYRGMGIGQMLLSETINRANKRVWSIPKRSALKTYEKVGFQVKSDFFKTETSDENCFVIYV